MREVIVALLLVSVTAQSLCGDNCKDRDCRVSAAGDVECYFDCKSTTSWSDEKKSWCCKEEHICDFDCQTDEEWSIKKSMWCCSIMNECSYNCKTRELWTEVKTKWCCEVRNMGCPFSQPPQLGDHCDASEPKCDSGLSCQPQLYPSDQWVCKSRCNSDADCDERFEFCKAAFLPTGDCDFQNQLRERVCIKRLEFNSRCGGYSPPCFETKCGLGMTCEGEQQQVDGSGVCVRDIIQKGEVCKTRDYKIGGYIGYDLSKRCKSGLSCQPALRDGDGDWVCKQSFSSAGKLGDFCEVGAECDSGLLCQPQSFADIKNGKWICMTSCSTDGECIENTEFCKPLILRSTGFCEEPYSGKGVCSKRTEINSQCGGFVPYCMVTRCELGMTCEGDQQQVDGPGVCVRDIIQKGEVCKTRNYDVSHFEGFDLSHRCDKGLSCLVAPSSDWICQVAEILKEGEVCKSGGVESGFIMDKRNMCAEGLLCKPREDVAAPGGEVPWICATSINLKLGEGEVCKTADINREYDCDSGLVCDALDSNRYTCQQPEECHTDKDCIKSHVCRQTPGPNGSCERTGPKGCVRYASKGESCGGFMPACFAKTCHPNLKCIYNEFIADAPGTCQDPSEALALGDTCKAAGQLAAQRRCEVGLTCSPRDGTLNGEWSCQLLTPTPPRKLAEGDVCFGKEVSRRYDCPVGLICDTKDSLDDVQTCRVPEPCESNDDCSNTKHCRQVVDSKGGCDYDNQKACVPYSHEGEYCGGYTMICFSEACHPDFECAYNEKIADIPGVCVKKVMEEGDVCKTAGFNSFDRSSSCGDGLVCKSLQLSNAEGSWVCTKASTSIKLGEGEVCKTADINREYDCDSGLVCDALDSNRYTCQQPEECHTDKDCIKSHVCRQTPGPNGSCERTGPKGCVRYASKGESCGGFMPACFAKTCHPNLKCIYNEFIADAPGTCQDPSEALALGDTCKAAGQLAAQRRCEVGLTCSPRDGTLNGEWSCQLLTPTPPRKLAEGDVCFGKEVSRRYDCPVGLICDTKDSLDDVQTCRVPEPCESNDDCSNTKHCRQVVDSKGGCDYDNQKACVPYSHEGEYCGGYTMICFSEACHPDFECAYNEKIADIPGVCVKKVMEEGDVCKTAGFNSFDRSSSCGDGLVCKSLQLSNAEGSWVCTKASTSIKLGEGEVCKTADINREYDCDSGLVCDALDSNRYTCQQPEECHTDKDCIKSHVCRQTPGPNGSCERTGPKGCVRYASKGESCGGFMPACFAKTCHPNLKCIYNEFIADAPGTCQDPSEALALGDTCKAAGQLAAQRRCEVGLTCSPRDGTLNGEWSCQLLTPTPPRKLAEGDVCFGKEVSRRYDCPVGLICDTKDSLDDVQTCRVPEPCESNDDCSNTKHCRQVVDSKGGCDYDNQKACVPYSHEGEYCGGYTMICFSEACHPDFECAYNEKIADIPGVCVKKVMEEGDVCKTAGFNSFDRSSSCVSPLVCAEDASEAEKRWTCQYSPKCQSDRKSAILCSPTGRCPPEKVCSGCMPCTDDKECQPVCLDKPTTGKCIHARSLSEEQMEDCCTTDNEYCKAVGDRYRCKTETTLWGFQQRQWCCDNQKMGCPIPEYDCTLKSQLFGTRVEDLLVHKDNQNVCCKHYNIGCPVEEKPDCSDGQRLPWSETKRQYCCAAENINCPPKIDIELYHKCRTAQLKDTLFDKQECCNRVGVGCHSEKFDCFTTTASVWSSEQQNWCCSEFNIACPVDCNSPQLLSMEHSQYCCELKGLRCTDPFFHESSDIDFRISFRGAFSMVQSNPKRFHKHMQQTLIRASATLLNNPSLLKIKFIGWVMSNGDLPPTKNLQEHGIRVSVLWSEESDIIEFDTKARGSLLSGSSQSRIGEHEHVFVDFETNSEIAINELKQASKLATTNEGSFSNNGDGYAFILENATIQKSVNNSPNDSNDSIPAWVIALTAGATCGVMFLAIGVVLLVKKRRNANGVLEVTMPPTMELKVESSSDHHLI